MEQLRDFSDNRLFDGCIYCGDQAQTNDHVPSRVLLDEPFPENLPGVPACAVCNQGFSLDEQYLACLIEAAVAGSTSPDRIRRSKISDILLKNPALRSRIENAKFDYNGLPALKPETHRVKNIVMKLARGHAAFELSAVRRGEPSYLSYRLIAAMEKDELDDYNAPHFTKMIAEVGSRSMQRISVVQFELKAFSAGQDPEDMMTVGSLPPAAEASPGTNGFIVNNWIDVQDDRYRYLAVDDSDGIIIKFVIGEYLACEVRWEHKSNSTS